MGIDVNQTRSTTFDRNKYYKAKYVDKTELVQDAVAQGVFYSTDKEPFKQEMVGFGNVQRKQVTGTLLTFDNVGDLEPNDFVLYRGELYLVVKVIGNDKNENKEFSSRPSFATEISLRR